MIRNITKTYITQKWLTPVSSLTKTNLAMRTYVNAPLTKDTMNQQIFEVKYAVRGPIVARALELEEELRKNPANFSFSEVIKCNIGDCHATGQSPMTLIRQVVSGLCYPEIADQFPKDVQDRISYIRAACGGQSVGAYSNSAGLTPIRENIAKYINERDGCSNADPTNIFLTDGASGGIVQVMKMLPKQTGVMIPIPQYPLYTATIAELDLTRCDYYLNEQKNWSLELEELQRSFDAATEKNGASPKVICIINPGNPTGNVLSRENLQNIIKFAYENDMVVLSDEVYQDNVYAEGCKFYSMRSMVQELGEPYASKLMYASFHSTSKGYMGECGFRAGYMELNNWDAVVQSELNKMQSTRLCPPVIGQAVMDCVVNRPKPGDESYATWKQEKDSVMESLHKKAELTAKGFNSINGVSCQTIQGAMYSFPSITMPNGFIEHCKSQNQEPDAVYCMDLLNTTGVCVVPGSGFGQVPGTYHFRMTILPPADKMEYVMKAFGEFHQAFLKQWE